MSELTNRVYFMRRYSGEQDSKSSNTRKLGIIFTSDYPSLNEQHVEDVVSKNFNIGMLQEIITVGKKETSFKYANRFAKKHSIAITPYRLETYSWEENDLFIKRNANIVYNSDSVIIFHGDETRNLVAWYALSVTARVISRDGQCIFASIVQPPELIGLEKEIVDVFKMPRAYSESDPYAFMEAHYLELMSGRRSRFAKYVQQGENMPIKRILFKLTEVVLKDSDLDYMNGYSFVAEIIFDSLICLVNKEFQLDEYGSPDEAKIEEYIKKEINPNFHYRNSDQEEDVIDIMFYHDWYKLEYLLRNMINHYEFNDDEEACAALCFGKWIRTLQKREFTNESIIQKYNNLQSF